MQQLSGGEQREDKGRNGNERREIATLPAKGCGEHEVRRRDSEERGPLRLAVEHAGDRAEREHRADGDSRACDQLELIGRPKLANHADRERRSGGDGERPPAGGGVDLRQVVAGHEPYRGRRSRRSREAHTGAGEGDCDRAPEADDANVSPRPANR